MPEEATYPRSANVRRARCITGYFALGLPVALFVAVLAANCVNAPRDDDLQSVVPFVNHWPTTHGFRESWKLLAAQYYGHRIALTRLVAWAEVALTGHLDVLALQVVGWCAWIALSVVILRRSAAVRQHAWLGLPVVLVMMQPQGQTNLLIGMQAVQNIGVVLLAFVGLALAEANTRRAWVALVAVGVAAVFTSANGVIVLPLAGIVLWQKGHRRFALVTLLAAAAVTGLFLHGYVSEPARWSAVEFFQNLTSLFGTPLRFERLPVPLAEAAGAVLLLLASICIVRDWRSETHGVVARWLAFLLLSGAMIARARIGWGVDYLGQDRYRLYSLLTMAVLYTRGLDCLPSPRRSRFAGLAIAASLAFASLSYACSTAEMVNGAEWAKATAMNQQLGRTFLRTTTARWPLDARDWEESVRDGHLRPPALLSATELESIRQLSHSIPSSGIAQRVRATPFEPVNGYLLESPDRPDAPVADFAVYADPDGSFILPIYRARAVLGDVARQHRIFAPGYALVLPAAIAKTGSHALYGVRRHPSGAVQILWTGIVQNP